MGWRQHYFETGPHYGVYPLGFGRSYTIEDILMTTPQMPMGVPLLVKWMVKLHLVPKR